MSNLINEIVLPLCGVSIAAVAVMRMYLANYYSRSCPTVPHPDEGRTFPLTANGVTVYLTEQESYWLGRRSRWVFIVPVLLGMASIFLGALRD
jgi:hypothetical protein